MKSIYRLGALVLLVAFAIVPAINAYAQTQMCFGLADTDCKLFYGAFDSANMAKLTAFQMAYSINGKGSGGGSGGEFHVDGTGSFGIDTTAASTADSSNPMGALSALMFSNVIKASGGATGGQSQTVNLEIRVVKGNIYFKSAELNADKWQYTSVADVSKLASQYMASMGSASSGSSGSSSPMGAMSAMQSPEMQQALAAIPTIPGVVTAASADGDQVDGIATKKVTFNIDLVKLVQAKEFRPVIEQSLKQQTSGTTVTADQAIQLASTALKDSKVQFWSTVGTDGVLRGIGFTLAFNIDDATAKAMNMTSGGGSANVDFAFNISKVGQPVTVEAPAGAEKLTLPGSTK
jgi:hypothetical protein